VLVELHFPILTRRINNKRLVYLDSAATTQKPKQVIEAIRKYYENSNANVHRGVHLLSEEATGLYEGARETVASFINAEKEEIVFTKNATEAINLVANTVLFTKDDEIVLTKMEHHANIVPWQMIAEKTGAKLRFVNLTKEHNLDMAHFRSVLNKNTKLVAVTHMSNVLGVVNDVKKIKEMAGVLVLVDAAQSVAHRKIDVKDIDCDFLVFSAHKMYGPTGIGVLYAKKELLETLPPFLTGGDMIKTVSVTKTTFNDIPHKFEAGTPNIAGAVGFAEAVRFMEEHRDFIHENEQELSTYCREQLQKISGIRLFSEGPIISFTLDNIHPHDIAAVVDGEGVAIRGGHHCAMPLMHELDIQGTARISIGVYNTKEDIDIVISALKKAKEIFR
jgi:cysteine desulfurase / selenocysteine lyase